MRKQDLKAFMDTLLAEATASGIEAAEVYCQSGDSFSANAMDAEITSYEVSSSCGLSLRGVVSGKMGYAATQAFDDEAIRQLIEGVLESAALTEEEDQDELYAGDPVYPELPAVESDISGIPSKAKLDALQAMQQAAAQTDERIGKVEGMVSTQESFTLLKNTLGLDLERESALAVTYCGPIAKEGDSTVTGFKLDWNRRFDGLQPAQTGRLAAENALEQLHASPVPTGTYRTILWHGVMGDLLTTFSGVFSAESAQQKLSLLRGKEGTQIASEAVTLMDDPLLPGGLASCAFDDEGSATRTKAVIDHGILTTLLHSRKTAKKDGVQTTGNAFRAGYSAPVRVAPRNFFFAPGEKDLDALIADLGEGLVITEVDGLHAGANPTSGDFSLLSKGYTVKDGKRGRPVEQITIAGNFYDLLRQIRAVGSDLTFDGSPIGSPSVDVGEMKISG